jgi:glutamine amidotransferase PdxT
MIFLADTVTNQKKGGQVVLKGLHCTVERNHFGAQKESFETFLNVPQLGKEPVCLHFLISSKTERSELFLFEHLW